jgi:hypothetical protein
VVYIVLALRSLKQEDLTFEVGMGYIAISCLKKYVCMCIYTLTNIFHSYFPLNVSTVLDITIPVQLNKRTLLLNVKSSK